MTDTLASVACCAPLAAPALSDEEALATADVFRSLGDAGRVRIVNLLANRRVPASAEEFVEQRAGAVGEIGRYQKEGGWFRSSRLRARSHGLLDRLS